MKQLKILFPIVIAIILIWVGYPKLNKWLEYKEVSESIETSEKALQKSYKYKLDEVDSIEDLLLLNKFELEESQKLYDKFGSTQFNDINYKLRTRVEINEVIWKLTQESIEILKFGKMTSEYKPADFMHDIENLHALATKSVKHFSESSDYVSNQREEFRVKLQQQGLDEETRIAIWSYIDNRTNSLQRSFRESNYDGLKIYSEAVLKLIEFLKSRKEFIRIESGEFLVFDSYKDRFTVSDMARAIDREANILRLSL